MLSSLSIINVHTKGVTHKRCWCTIISYTVVAATTFDVREFVSVTNKRRKNGSVGYTKISALEPLSASCAIRRKLQAFYSRLSSDTMHKEGDMRKHKTQADGEQILGAKFSFLLFHFANHSFLV